MLALPKLYYGAKYKMNLMLETFNIIPFKFPGLLSQDYFPNHSGLISQFQLTV